ENDYQAAIMAPTELLAEQHVATLTRLLAPLEVHPELLIGRLSAAEKQGARQRIAAGASRLVVGTHALIQEDVRFRRLGVAVIDEQHRFGVEQRAALVEKGDAPDVLLLTATPIPRSLALTMFGDQAATVMAGRIAKVFPDLVIGVVHGRLKPEERDVTMRAFRDNAVHILVATSVIEVGIDVANA